MLENLRHVAVATRSGVRAYRPRGERAPGREVKAWEMVGYGLYDQFVTNLAKGPDGRLIVCTRDRMLATTDDWERWRWLYQGLPYPHVCAAVSCPSSGRIYAGSTPAALFVSEDGGETWVDRNSTFELSFRNGWSHPEPPHQPRLFRLHLHPDQPETLIGAVQSGGVLVSRDGGRSWVNTKAGLSSQLCELVYHPERPQTLYAANFLGFYRSDDLGRTFQQSNTGLPYRRATALCAHSLDPDRLLLAVDHPLEERSLLFASHDGGRSWDLACSALPGDEELNVTCLESGGGVFFVGTAEGSVFGSRDGYRWELVGNQLPPVTRIMWLGEVNAWRHGLARSQSGGQL